MKYKKSMIILVLAIFIFGVASVCASDMNDTAVANEDTSQIELSQDNEADADNLETNEEKNKLSQADNDESMSVAMIHKSLVPPQVPTQD